MSWSANLPADDSLIRISAGLIRANEGAVQNVLTTDNLTGGNPYIATGFPMYFYNGVAPTGWLVYSTPTDCLLALVGGASDYKTANVATVAGTWNGPGEQITLTELPQQQQVVTGGGPGPVYGLVGGGSLGSAHEHDWVDTRPTAAVGILATKND